MSRVRFALKRYVGFFACLDIVVDDSIYSLELSKKRQANQEPMVSKFIVVFPFISLETNFLTTYHLLSVVLVLS